MDLIGGGPQDMLIAVQKKHIYKKLVDDSPILSILYV